MRSRELVITPQREGFILGEAHDRANTDPVYAGRMAFYWTGARNHSLQKIKYNEELCSSKNVDGLPVINRKAGRFAGGLIQTMGKGSSNYTVALQNQGMGWITLENGAEEMVPGVELVVARTPLSDPPLTPTGIPRVDPLDSIQQLAWVPDPGVYVSALEAYNLKNPPTAPVRPTSVPGRWVNLDPINNLPIQASPAEDAMLFAQIASEIFNKTPVDDRARVSNAILREMVRRAYCLPDDMDCIGHVEQVTKGQWRESGSRDGRSVIVKFGAPFPPCNAFAGNPAECKIWKCCTP